jgi:hypothetical protein
MRDLDEDVEHEHNSLINVHWQLAHIMHHDAIVINLITVILPSMPGGAA